MAKASKAPTENALTKVAAGTLADLIGKSVSIKLDNGQQLIIPADRGGNRVANMIVVAELRHIIQNSIKTYRDKEMIPTPKDLKDLAEAIKSLAQSSGDVYKEDDGVAINAKPKVAEPASPASGGDVDFDEALGDEPGAGSK